MSDDENHLDFSISSEKTHQRRFTNRERQKVIEYLLLKSSDYILPRGTLSKAALKFDCNRKTVSRIWQRGLLSLEQGASSMVADTKHYMSGRKEALTRDQFQKLMEAHLNQSADQQAESSPSGRSKKKSLRALAEEMRIPKTTLLRYRAREKHAVLSAAAASIQLQKDEAKNEQTRREHTLEVENVKLQQEIVFLRNHFIAATGREAPLFNASCSSPAFSRPRASNTVTVINEGVKPNTNSRSDPSMVSIVL